MEKLPELAKRLIYEYDNTYKEKFKDVMIELKTKMKRRFIQGNNPRGLLVYGVTKWECEIRLRRKSKVSKYLIKTTRALKIIGDMIYPVQHNRKADQLWEIRTLKKYQNIERWKNMVRNYLNLNFWLMNVIKHNKRRLLQLLN